MTNLSSCPPPLPEPVLGGVVLPTPNAETQRELDAAEACLRTLWSAANADHARQVAILALTLGEACRAVPNFVERRTLLWGAMLHDVGKSAVPERILLKPGGLSAEERRVIQEHPKLGERLVTQKAPQVSWQARSIVLHHHERYDGRGYPSGLSGGSIPLLARVVQVADVFDALTAERPYRLAWGVSRALAYVESQSGTQFDPLVVRALRRLVAPEPGLAGPWPYPTPGG